MQQTDLSRYNNSPFHPGGNALKRTLWFYINALFFRSALIPVSGVKVFLLRMFGAKIGKHVTIKPYVSIKYPWHLTIGNYTWLGESVWIDCLVPVIIGSNVCISQGALILTGSHNYKKATFDLITEGVVLEDGVWIGARAVVTAGVTAASHAVLAAGAIATKNLEAYGIYRGDPAEKKRRRIIE